VVDRPDRAPYWQVEVDCNDLDPGARELLIGDLWSWSTSGVEERGGRIFAGFEQAADAHHVVREVGRRAIARAITDDSYLDAWREFASPSIVGRLFIRPRWSLVPSPRGLTEVSIEPGRAFGSGAHASTLLALELLQRIGLGGRTVLDFGCGSGVLSVAAALLGASAVVALDIDPDATRVTRANAEHNGVGGRVQVVAGTIDAQRGAFDVVVANVLPSVHREVAAALRRSATRSIIVSGMLDASAVDVERAYGLTVVERRRRDQWTAAMLRIDHPQPAP